MINSARVSMNDNEQKKVMLNILLSFAHFCDDHQLVYWLDAGTLIGAVRHKGFIPWDDDIDVGMPRKDFDKFMELMRKQEDKIGEYLYLERPEDVMYPFPKLADKRTILVEHPEKKPEEVAVYIDIFPKDGIKDKGISSKILCKICELFELIQWFNHYSIYAWSKSTSPTKRVIGYIGRKLVKNPNWGVPIQQKIIRSHNQKVDYSKCEFVTTLVRGEFHKLAPRSCFDEQIVMPFENYEFKIPKGYDTYLRCLYKGDYMQLPPEDKRKGHNTILYWVSKEAKEEFFNQII